MKSSRKIREGDPNNPHEGMKVRDTLKHVSVASNFAMAAAIVPFMEWLSNMLAARRTISLEAINFVAISATLNWRC